MSALVRLSHTSTLANINTFHSNSSTSGRALLDLTGSHSSGYGDKCCPPVVDPYTWLALIGGIALATFFLQMAIVNNIMPGRRKRRSTHLWHYSQLNGMVYNEKSKQNLEKSQHG